MNWGWRIFILYTSFIAFMLVMVYKCTQQNIDLVTENYYAKELKFQDQYQRIQNSTATGMQLGIEFKPENRLLAIAFPSQVTGQKVTGEVFFFRPDNKKLDYSVPVELASGNLQQIDCNKMARGLWKVQVKWNAGDTGLYEEKQVFIP
jgi:nitrogen fixation protein FixH